MKRHGITGLVTAALALAAAAAWAQGDAAPATDAPDTAAPANDSRLDNAYHIIPNADAKPGDSPYSAALRAAVADFQAGRLGQATTELQGLEAKAPNDATVHSILGYIYLKQNKSADAVGEMRTVVKLVPRDPGGRKNLGRAYLQTQDYPNAAEQFRAVLAASPLDEDAQFGLALALGHMDQYEQSAAGFRKVIAAKPSAAAYQNLGVVLQKSGQYTEAADAFQQASALDSANPADYLDAGLLYAQTGADDKAIVALSQALALGVADKYHAHLALAQAYSHSSANGKAIQEFNAASEINPSDPTVFYNLGVLNQQGGQTSVAEDNYRKVLSLSPTDPKILLNTQTNLGLLLANDGKADEAKPLLTAAEQADPKAAAPHAALGNLYARQGDAADAISERRTALGLDPSDSQTRLLLADSLLAQKKYAEAAQQYGAVAKDDPDNTSVQNALGTAYEELGQTLNARAAFQAAVAGHGTAKEKAQAQNNLGVVYEKQGKKALAIAAYKKAAALDPNLAEAKRNLARFSPKP